MTSLSLICEYGSSSEDEDVVEVMEVEGAVKENLNPLGELPPPPTPFKVASLFDADIIAVVESLISRVERRHQHHYQNNNHHHNHHHHQQYPFSTSSYRNGNDNHDEEETSEEESAATSDSDSELSVWSAFSVEDEEEEEEDCFDGSRKAAKATQGRPKAKHCVTKGEFTVDDLPPIERLQISVDVRCLTQVGIVCSMVNQLVVVQSFKSVPVLDLETVLFCREGTSIGQIFDVIGPVKQPNYVLRFNSPEEAAVDCKLALNSPIYYAEENGAQQQQQLTRPENCLTRYVFVQQLQAEKGCDASWKHNNEPPPEEIDYSDDEEERARKRRAQKRTRGAGGGGFRSSSGVPTF